jgi:antitoxin component YwqK of YwqJK toxin-antitoxin module
MLNFRKTLGFFALLALVACKVPEQRITYYPNGFLKERYWVYQDEGREVMDGLYTSWYSNGKKEAEILYHDGAEFTKTYYSERGTLLGTVKVASEENSNQ